MIRTQVQLTQLQSQVLKQWAVRRGTSMAELIRQSIDQFICREETPEDEMKAKRQRAKMVSGLFSSGLPDLGRNHDRYLVEAYSNGRYTEDATGDVTEDADDR